MTTTTETEKKDRVLKTLAVGGFVGLIIIIAWLGIQLIGFMPNALTSLASLADSVYNYEDITLEVERSKDTVAVGETFGLTWNVPKTPGDFTFTYECTEGVAVSIRTIGGTVTDVTCDTDYPLGNVSGVDVMVESEKTNSTDVPYTVTFVPKNTNSAVALTDGSVTVINTSIPAVLVTATTTPVVVPVVVPAEPKPETPVVPVTPVTPKPTTPPVTTKPVETYTYAIPTSNPNGFTDIAVAFSNVGTLSNGTFVTTGTIDNDNGGVLLFTVKNIGTKTSNSFTYSVKLPNGTTYTSKSQVALKPNERASIAIGIDGSTELGTKSFSVNVTSSGETVTSNNGFTDSVVITD